VNFPIFVLDWHIFYQSWRCLWRGLYCLINHRRLFLLLMPYVGQVLFEVLQIVQQIAFRLYYLLVWMFNTIQDIRQYCNTPSSQSIWIDKVKTSCKAIFNYTSFCSIKQRYKHTWNGNDLYTMGGQWTVAGFKLMNYFDTHNMLATVP